MALVVAVFLRGLNTISPPSFEQYIVSCDFSATGICPIYSCRSICKWDLFYSTEITLYLDRKTDGSMVQTEDVYLVLESVASQIYDAGLKSDFEGYITSDYLNRFYKKTGLYSLVPMG